ncbi:hypothetical protein AB0M79_03650 [Polymorphospora sp. NPDC051019]|uniref:hypothetical protein n=1 Tax=Polymorphospora sp. NPDC051019 TaxID=3155725 RepID=UPI003431D795
MPGRPARHRARRAARIVRRRRAARAGRTGDAGQEGVDDPYGEVGVVEVRQRPDDPVQQDRPGQHRHGQLDVEIGAQLAGGAGTRD